MSFVGRKLVDYGWTPDRFKAALAQRVDALKKPETALTFKAEMSRFVDGNIAMYLTRDSFVKKYLERSEQLAKRILAANIDPPI